MLSEPDSYTQRVHFTVVNRRLLRPMLVDGFRHCPVKALKAFESVDPVPPSRLGQAALHETLGR